MAALLASLPRTISLASSTCHWRTIPFLEGNCVLIDTRLHFVASNYLEYRAERRMSNRGWAAFRPPRLVASGWWLAVLPASPRIRPIFWVRSVVFMGWLRICAFERSRWRGGRYAWLRHGMTLER